MPFKGRIVPSTYLVPRQVKTSLVIRGWKSVAQITPLLRLGAKKLDESQSAGKRGTKVEYAPTKIRDGRGIL